MYMCKIPSIKKQKYKQTCLRMNMLSHEQVHHLPPRVSKWCRPGVTHHRSAKPADCFRA